MNNPTPFAEYLLSWYANNARDLPWRIDVSAYTTWISEILLQQTRLNQGIIYYHRFIERFPDISSLAEASEEEVLKLWQGLGYCSRARNLHEGVRQIIENYHGQIPSSFQELKKIKGIGSYTAAAISSIVFHQAVPAIDGNAIRVFSRFMGINDPVDTSSGRISIEKAAYSLMDQQRPGDFNQAVMELGALVCTPKRPACFSCPLINGCIAYREDKIDLIPSKHRKTRVKERYIFYLVILSHAKNNMQVIIKKRDQNDIWKGLYDFPSLEFDGPADKTAVIESENLKIDFPYLSPAELKFTKGPSKHILSHRTLCLNFLVFESTMLPAIKNKKHRVISIDEAIHLPLPRPIEKFLEELIVGQIP